MEVPLSSLPFPSCLCRKQEAAMAVRRLVTDLIGLRTHSCWDLRSTAVSICQRSHTGGGAGTSACLPHPSLPPPPPIIRMDLAAQASKTVATARRSSDYKETLFLLGTREGSWRRPCLKRNPNECKIWSPFACVCFPWIPDCGRWTGSRKDGTNSYGVNQARHFLNS